MPRERNGSYQLARPTSGGALFGLRVPQVILLGIALGVVVLATAIASNIWGVCLGAAMAAVSAITAFGRMGGDPIYGLAPTVARFLLHRADGRNLWTAPLPLLTGAPGTPIPRLAQGPGRREHVLPRCLSGMELHAIDRPIWAGPDRTLAPVGVIRDRRRETLTIAMSARGRGFSLLENVDQHTLLGAWGQVLAQFGRESSPVVRLGWTLWSAPSTAGASNGHLQWLSSQSVGHSRRDDVAAEYRTLLDEAVVHRHELRIWITVAAESPSGPAGERGTRRPDPADAALAAAKALRDRCAVAGLSVSGPLSPIQIAEATRSQADPGSMRPSRHGGLAERAGLATGVDPSDAGPLTVEAHWDAVRVDGSWHRAFWISQWPQHVSDPRWLESLLMSPPSVRTLAVSYEPVSPRASRRKITSEAVAIGSQLQLRERHDLRVPVGLKHAHEEIDQREAELGAGHTEVGLLALLVVTESSLERLDLACQATLDVAAQCGISELRPLHARHDAAWACALPLGRVPDRELLQGLPG